MCADVGAVEEGHPELHAIPLRKLQQSLPDTQAWPTDEGLSHPRLGTEVRGDGAPLGSVLMPPEDSRDRVAQILRRGLPPPSADTP